MKHKTILTPTQRETLLQELERIHGCSRAEVAKYGGQRAIETWLRNQPLPEETKPPVIRQW